MKTTITIVLLSLTLTVRSESGKFMKLESETIQRDNCIKIIHYYFVFLIKSGSFLGLGF